MQIPAIQIVVALFDVLVSRSPDWEKRVVHTWIQEYTVAHHDQATKRRHRSVQNSQVHWPDQWLQVAFWQGSK